MKKLILVIAILTGCAAHQKPDLQKEMLNAMWINGIMLLCQMEGPEELECEPITADQLLGFQLCPQPQ